MSVKITFFGQSGAGKTKLVRRMLNPQLPVAFETSTTFGAEIDTKRVGNLSWEISNLSGLRHHQPYLTTFYKNADIAVYCVDLSEPISNEDINKDINDFRALNRDAAIILVGTKSDACPETAQEQLDSITNQSFVNRFCLSAHNDKHLATFLQHLTHLGEQRLSKKIATMPKAELAELKIDPLLYARDQLPPESPFYQALDSLAESLHHLPDKVYRRIGREALNLVNAFHTDDPLVQVPQALQTFSDNCRNILPVTHSYLRNAILSVVAAVAVTILVALAGFTLGCIIGLWAGPLAFVSGIATSYAAISLLSVSGAVGLGSGLLTAHCLFRQENKIQTKIIDEVVEAAADYRPQELMPN